MKRRDEEVGTREIVALLLLFFFGVAAALKCWALADPRSTKIKKRKGNRGRRRDRGLLLIVEILMCI
jgi:hypothetical protein